MTLVNLALAITLSAVLTFVVVAAFVIGYNAGVRWGVQLVEKSAVKIGYAEYHINADGEREWRWRIPEEINERRKI